MAAAAAAACTSQVSDKAAPSVPFKQNVFLKKKICEDQCEQAIIV